MVEEGETFTRIVGAVPLKEPDGESVPLIVPLPVTAMPRLVFCPLQMVIVPVIADVGLALMFTMALPLLALEQLCASVNVAMV